MERVIEAFATHRRQNPGYVQGLKVTVYGIIKADVLALLLVIFNGAQCFELSCIIEASASDQIVEVSDLKYG